jgi:hypothetical protein
METVTSPEKMMPSEPGRVYQSVGKGGQEKRICLRKSESRMEKCGGRNRRIRIKKKKNRRARTRTRGQVAEDVFMHPAKIDCQA